jgi:hypothetical protein
MNPNEVTPPEHKRFAELLNQLLDSIDRLPVNATNEQLQHALKLATGEIHRSRFRPCFQKVPSRFHRGHR